MTDERRAYEKAICEVAKVSDIGDVSDGFHTFNSLYEQRMILFAALVRAYRDKAWKSYRHEDGEYCFGGEWFIVGIDTPEGSYTYHYENKYWDMFDCADLPRAKHWDGHTEADAETRLMSLVPTVLQWIPCSVRLPEEDTDVLITYRYKEGEGDTTHAYIDITSYGDMFFGGNPVHDSQSGNRVKHWRQPFAYFTSNYEVIAWMSLPEPWKEGIL